jgi:hypothetical protein
MKPKLKKFKCQRLDLQTPSDDISSASSCMSCGQPEHVNAKECQSHRPTLNEFLNNQFRVQFEHFTRKIYLRPVMRPVYQGSFFKVTELGEFTRNVIFCAQISINNHVVQVPSALDAVTQRNLWYSICQLTIGQFVTRHLFQTEQLLLSMK